VVDGRKPLLSLLGVFEEGIDLIPRLVGDCQRLPARPGSADITRAQARAVEALVAGARPDAAAASAGVSARTLRRWKRTPGFDSALRAAQDEAFSSALRELRAATLDSVRSLREVAANENSAPTARVAAASCVIELAIRSWESKAPESPAAMQDVIKARLEQKLEQFLRSRGAGRQPSEREDLTESTREAVSARREMPPRREPGQGEVSVASRSRPQSRLEAPGDTAGSRASRGGRTRRR
jgi:hypothetical protein